MEGRGREGEGGGGRGREGEGGGGRGREGEGGGGRGREGEGGGGRGREGEGGGGSGREGEGWGQKWLSRSYGGEGSRGNWEGINLEEIQTSSFLFYAVAFNVKYTFVNKYCIPGRQAMHVGQLYVWTVFNEIRARLVVENNTIRWKIGNLAIKSA